MPTDWLIKLWDKGGVTLVLLAFLFALAWFVGRRGVKAFDRMATAQVDSMQTMATSIQTSTAAQVVALGQLTDRVSRMEGKVDTLGSLAVRGVHVGPAQVAVASAVEVFEGEDATPIHGTPIPIAAEHASPIARRSTPPKGIAPGYRPPGRPGTKGG